MRLLAPLTIAAAMVAGGALTWSPETRASALPASAVTGLSNELAGPVAGPSFDLDPFGRSPDLLALQAVQEAELTAVDASTADHFGYAVAVSGDVAVVGAPDAHFGGTRQGCAYVFVREGASWREEARLTAPAGTIYVGADGDQFGASVALRGTSPADAWVAIGAPGADIGANVDQGSVYLFAYSDGYWDLQEFVSATDGAAFDRFGTAVGISSGHTVVVGSPQANLGANANQGAAYVFVSGPMGQWQQQAKLTAVGAAADLFGRTVAISGETALIGAPCADPGGTANRGAAYAFVRSGTTWSLQQSLTAADGSAADFLGNSVAIDGETAVVGASADDNGPAVDQGSAYVYTRTGTTWSQQAKLIATEGAAGDAFGFPVSISGDTVAAGASGHQVGTAAEQGCAFVFVRAGAAWSQQAQVTSARGATQDHFGFSAAVSGDTIVAGAPDDSVGGYGAAGSASFFVRTSSAWSQQAQVVAGGSDRDWFGCSVAISGDIAVAGAPYRDAGANSDHGAAYVFVRDGWGWSQQTRLTAVDGAQDDRFGASVVIDGQTMLVGAAGDDIGNTVDRGAVYVFVRDGAGWTQEAKLTADDGVAEDRFGSSVAIDGDTAVVGAGSHDVGANADQGEAYVFTRSGSVWTQQARLTASDGAANDYFGSSVAIDGGAIAVGAVNDKVGTNARQGSAYIFAGSGATWSRQAKVTAGDGDVDDWFGGSVALDSGRLLVGAPGDNVGRNKNAGSAYVFVRSRAKWIRQGRLSRGVAHDYLGMAVALSGRTAMVGATSDSIGQGAAQGLACAFMWDGTGWRRRMTLRAADGHANDQFGWSIGIDGDSAVIGAPAHSSGIIGYQGSAYVFSRMTAPPVKPVGRSPKGLIDSRTPTLRWRWANGASVYEVRIYKGRTLLRKMTGLGALSWQCTRRLPRDVWLTWKVRGVNQAGPGPWSAGIRFMVR